MITVLTVDEALQHVCAIFREHADRSEITPAERDLLIDGAILLAMCVDDHACDSDAGPDTGCPEKALPTPVGRHERQTATVAA